jgi:hypothetical protein
MHHDDHVCARGQRLAIARLLVAAVAVVAVVDEVVQAESLRDLDCVIGAVIVHEDAGIHGVGQLPHRRFQRLFRVIGG